MTEISGLFTSRQEQIIPVEGNVKGLIPTWLEGKLISVGPGLFDIDSFSVNHFLDGFAMLSKFDIKNGKVTYSQKFIESESYKKAMIVKRPVFAEYGTHAFPDSTKAFLYRMFSTLVPTDLSDNNFAAIYSIEEECIAAGYTCFVHSIDADSLATKERHDLMKSCGTIFQTPHPLKDSEGNVWNIGQQFTTGCKYHVIKYPFVGSGKAADAIRASTIQATIPSSWKTCMSLITSFAMTDSYVIFIEQPLLINCVKLAQIGIKSKSLGEALEWNPAEKNRFIVVVKESGRVLRFIAQEQFFAIHFVNSYEKEDQIVVDLIGYPDNNTLSNFNLSNLRDNSKSQQFCEPSTYRFVIPLIHFAVDMAEGENLVTINDVTATAMRSGNSIILNPQIIGNSLDQGNSGPEFPVINPRFGGKPYRFFYGTGKYGEGQFKNSIGKINVETGVSKLFKVGENEFCGEPTFISKLDPTADEDDGIVLVPVSCNDTNKLDFLACLDAKTFQELARVEFETKFVQSLHGIFTWSFPRA